MKKVLSFLFLMLLATAAMAQSTMTDKQVLQFVQQEQSKGSNQQTIIQKLLQKGVTAEQIRRVRKNYEAQQQNMGAVDLTGSTEETTKTNRLRTNKEKAEDEYRKQNGFMVRSQRETEEDRYKTQQDFLDEMGDEIGFLDIDSLIYYQNYFKDLQDTRNQVFGRSIFNNELLTFEPNPNMATPPNYRLGAGDNVIIDIWGSTQLTVDDVISPDGVVVIEGIGPVKLAGMSVAQANASLKSTLGKYYEDCDISLSLGENRSIQVQVMGEVRMPGTYTISSLSSAFNALYSAGGISDIGTLRSIKIYRGGRVEAELDVYDYLLNGNSSGDIRLQDNDVIVVGPYECLVQVTGKVKRPMFYEMKSTETVKQVLKDAGGLSGDAYTKNVRLTRKAGAEYSMYTVDEFQMSDFTLMDGDSIYVDSVLARFNNMVEVRGAVKHAGQYQLGGDVQTVRGLLEIADGPREDAFLSRGVMHRLKDDRSLEMVNVDLEGILNETVPDVLLKNGDVLFVPSTIDMKGEQTLTISGEVMYPGVYQYAENTCVEDLILMAGGLTDGASMAKVDVFRRVQDARATENRNEIVQAFSMSLSDGFRQSDSSVVLMPYDEVMVRRSPAYSEQKNVTVSGEVNFTGDYSMTTRDYRLSDLVKAAGGLSELAYAEGARLIRMLTDAEKLMRESSLRTAQIQMYEDALQGEKTFDLAQADSLMTLKLDIGDYYPVAINLQNALKSPGSVDDILLREGDILSVPQYSNTVKVSGEVIYPMSMNYKKGQKAQYYIDRAGGYGNKAKKKGVYAIYINGAAKKINRRSGKDVQPGCEIVIPSKSTANAKVSTAEIMAIASGASSLAAVIVALTNVIK
ncbi:MAG: SLBB domain-containing protein [Prevotellaceae bacterium]|nr:SLBB domain-containing protein [Prevotellaceae bacterium]